MRSVLRLVASNPHIVKRPRPDGARLHRLADCLAQAVRSGNGAAARIVMADERLSPIGMAAVAARMARAGLGETEILAVMA